MQDFEETKLSRSSKAAKKDEFAQAAATPLPGEAKTEQEDEDEEDADMHAKPAKAGSKAHKAKQPAQQDLEDDEPAEGHAQAPAHTVQFPPSKGAMAFCPCYRHCIPLTNGVRACDIPQPHVIARMLQALKSKVAQLQGALSRLPWKWIVLALCLAALAGTLYHYREPLAHRCQQMELQARSRLEDAAAYIQGPLSKKACAWEHSVVQGFHRQRYGAHFCFLVFML